MYLSDAMSVANRRPTARGSIHVCFLPGLGALPRRPGRKEVFGEAEAPRTPPARNSCKKRGGEKTSMAVYRLRIREMPDHEKPRERLRLSGPSALSDAELLAILLRVGVEGMNVVQLAQQLLIEFGGWSG